MVCLVSSTKADGEASEEWKRSNALVKGWIYVSLSENVMDKVVDIKAAKDVWDKLELTYGTPAPPTITGKDPAEYLPLHKAIIGNDWEKAKDIFDNDNDALTAIVGTNNSSALHLAIHKENEGFFKNLLDKIDKKVLPTLLNCDKFNPLHLAASFDNTKAAEMLVEKSPNLLFLLDKKYLPIHRAAINSHGVNFKYLLAACEENIEISKEDGYYSPFEGKMGARLLTGAITSGFFDISVYLINKYPKMAITTCNSKYISPLSSIAGKGDSYYSGTRYGYYQIFIYSCEFLRSNITSFF